MPILNLYHKRKNLPEGKLSYELTAGIKIQIVHIWKDFFKQFPESQADTIWTKIHDILCREFQLKTLHKVEFGYTKDCYRVEHYFDNEEDTDKCLSVIELVFTCINFTDNGFYRPYTPSNAIQDLNARFIENSIGYEFQQNMIIKIDSTFLHRSIIEPAFAFISNETFKNVNEEFLKAHEYFRHNDNAGCLIECLKAFESTMKIICTENGWPYQQSDNANKLVVICLSNKLIPEYMQNHFTSLRATLEGIQTLRNKLAAHGKGTMENNVPNNLATYMLNLTGTTIHFLISCNDELHK